MASVGNSGDPQVVGHLGRSCVSSGRSEADKNQNFNAARAIEWSRSVFSLHKGLDFCPKPNVILGLR